MLHNALKDSMENWGDRWGGDKWIPYSSKACLVKYLTLRWESQFKPIVGLGDLLHSLITLPSPLWNLWGLIATLTGQQRRLTSTTIFNGWPNNKKCTCEKICCKDDFANCNLLTQVDGYQTAKNSIWS